MSPPAVAGSQLRRWRPRGRLHSDISRTPLLGDAVAGKLLPVHAMHSIGETMFGVLARRIAVLQRVRRRRPSAHRPLPRHHDGTVRRAGTLVGPIIDRVRGGHRAVLLVTLAGRAVLAVLLATQLKGLLFYPEAFALLVLAKTYQVSRTLDRAAHGGEP